MFLAEVIQRDGSLRLRAIDGVRTLLDIEGPAEGLAAGAIVRVALGEAPGTARLAGDDGAPVVAAAAGTALSRVYRIAARHGLSIAFPQSVLAEVEAIVTNPGIDDQALEDMCSLPFVTIDYEHSRDLDQAMFLERAGAGYRVYYALADAAYYVRPGTALFAEARRRSTSFYLPGLTVPMLPEALSEGIVSLNEGVLRRALVFVMTVNDAGAVQATSIVRARIRSRAKLTYDGVQRMHDDPDGEVLGSAEWGESLRLLADVGRLRIRNADERDVVKYDRVASRLSLSDDGLCVNATAEPRNDVQRWNEQISLMCNIEGARFLTDRVDQSTGFAGVFRVHPPPEDERLSELAALIGQLVDELGLPAHWRWTRSGNGAESLADYIDRLPDTGPRRRLTMALQRQAMLINHPSFFTTEPGPHYGIGAAAYSRFSSPMREMVGVVTKHMAFHQMHGTDVAAAGLTKSVIRSVVEAGNEAKKVQKRMSKEANKLAMDELFRADLKADPDGRAVHMGTVMGVSERKVYVQLDEPPVEIKLYAEDLTRDGGDVEVRNRFEIAIRTGDTAAAQTVRVGEALGVCAVDYQRDRRRWLFRIACATWEG